MAKNEIFHNGDSLVMPVDSTVASGDLTVFASGLAGVAETTAALGEDGTTYYATIRFDGVFAIPAGGNDNGIGKSAKVTLPTGNVGDDVALVANATSGAVKIGTIVGINDAGLVLVNLNK